MTAQTFKLRPPSVWNSSRPRRVAVLLGIFVWGCVGSCDLNRKPEEGLAKEPDAARQAQLVSDRTARAEVSKPPLPNGAASGTKKPVEAIFADRSLGLSVVHCTLLDVIFEYPGCGSSATEFTSRFLEIAPSPACDSATLKEPTRLDLESVRSSEPGSVDLVLIARGANWKKVLCTIEKGVPYGFAGKQVDKETLAYECVLPSGTKQGVLRIQDGAVTHRFNWNGSGPSLEFRRPKPTVPVMPYNGRPARIETESLRVTSNAPITFAARTTTGIQWSGDVNSIY